MPAVQIASDLHLETPLTRPSYDAFLRSFSLHARYLCLLGDIGIVGDGMLFKFFESLLKKSTNLIILFVLGNHEPYRMSLESARVSVQAFSTSMTSLYGERFIFLDRKRYDINPNLTVLGCTL